MLLLTFVMISLDGQIAHSITAFSISDTLTHSHTFRKLCSCITLDQKETAFYMRTTQETRLWAFLESFASGGEIHTGWELGVNDEKET